MLEIKISPYAIPGIRSVPQTPDLIINSVCSYFDVSKEQIKSTVRKREWVTARHIAIYLIKEKTKLTLKDIGQKFFRDHTTVIHAMQKINGFLDIHDEPTLIAIETISNNLRINN